MRLIQFLSILTVLTACRAPGMQPTSSWDAAMQAELLRRYADDQAVRERLMEGTRTSAVLDTAVLAAMLAVDTANTKWLQGAIERNGWPDRSVIGDSGARAVFLLVQHADQDTAFQAWMLPAITAAYQRGEADGQDAALLTEK